MKGDTKGNYFRDLFRPIEVPPSVPRPQSAVTADREEAWNRSGIKYVGQLMQRNYGWPNKSKGEASKRSDDKQDTEKK